MQTSSLDSLIVSPTDFDRYNGHHSLRTLELPRPVDDTSTILIDNASSPNVVARWLSQPSRRSNKDQASMKILLIQTRNQSTAKKPPSLSPIPVAFSPESLQLRTPECQQHTRFIINIFNELGLPLAAFGSYIKAHITFVCVPTNLSTSSNGSPTNSPSTAYYCSGTSWTISWSFNPILNHTVAVMFHREGDGDQRKNEVLADLLRLQTHLSHPMLLGYIKTKVSLSFTFDMLDDMNRETLALEQEIGFPTWNWVLDREMPGKGVAETQDLAVEGFNVLSGKLTNIRFRLKTFQQQIKFISRCNHQYRLSLDQSSPKFQSHARECEELDHFMNVMWDYTFIHLFDADSLGERLANAMSAVFQLTTQRDSRASLAVAGINNELAWQGKNTNKAMRTIAFVSLLFLPGTFVASFFDTPIFNFQMPSDHNQVVVTEPFWIFWSVSIVLTVALVLGWMSYLRRSKRIDLRERDLERQQLTDRIRKRQAGAPVAVLLEGRAPMSNVNSEMEMSKGSTWYFRKRSSSGKAGSIREFRNDRAAETELFGMPARLPFTRFDGAETILK